MKVKSVFVHLSARATIVVRGLGEVQTKDALSAELTERIAAECIAALRLKLGQHL